MYMDFPHGKGYLSGVAPKLALKLSPSERLTAGKYAYPGPNLTHENASPKLFPFLQTRDKQAIKHINKKTIL